MLVSYAYLPPLQAPRLATIDLGTVLGLLPIWNDVIPLPLLNRYTFEPTVYRGWLVGQTPGQPVTAPGNMNVLQTGFADTTGGVLMADATGHVTVYVSGLVAPLVTIGQLLVAGVTTLGVSVGAVFFQVAYLNVVFDPAILPEFQVDDGNVVPRT